MKEKTYIEKNAEFTKRTFDDIRGNVTGSRLELLNSYINTVYIEENAILVPPSQPNFEEADDDLAHHLTILARARRVSARKHSIEVANLEGFQAIINEVSRIALEEYDADQLNQLITNYHGWVLAGRRGLDYAESVEISSFADNFYEMTGLSVLDIIHANFFAVGYEYPHSSYILALTMKEAGYQGAIVIN